MSDVPMNQVAQVNIALPAEPLDSDRLAEFVANLDPVNAMADSACGFVWRMQTEDGDGSDRVRLHPAACLPPARKRAVRPRTGREVLPGLSPPA